MSENLSNIILRTLLNNDNYLRKVIPFLKPSYFEGSSRVIFKQIAEFVDKHNKLPTLDAFRLDLEENDKISESMYAEIAARLPEIFSKTEIDEDFILEKTESWCQERAIHIAIMESINILDGKNEKMTKNAIPELLSEALGVTFDNAIGHDYIEDAEKRFDFYNQAEDRISFDLEYFNKITKGGLPNKTLNIILAGCVHPSTKVRVRFRKKST